MFFLIGGDYMLKTFQITCPTKDKTVSLVVNYIPAGALEDNSPVYIKGIVHSCTGQSSDCNNCGLYEKLPQQI